MKPSRSREKGREARAGSSQRRVETTRINSKAFKIPAEIGESAPPASIAGTTPARISSMACPIASVLLVHPVLSTWLGPRRCRAMDSSLERLPCVPAVME